MESITTGQMILKKIDMKWNVLMVSCLFLIISTEKIYGQNAQQDEKIFIEKRSCSINDINGFKLLIHYVRNGIEIVSKPNNYGLTEFIGLNDTVKMQIVERLLAYKYDTSIVCINVLNYGYEGYENTCMNKPVAKQYSIQIDALYMINKLCFPQSSSFYYCYPVLIDTLTNKEINQDFALVADFFSQYEKWFKQNKASKSIETEFPFNNGRYVWFGGRNNRRI